MQVFVCRAKHAGQVVSKDYLMQNVWQDTFVTEDVLIRSISELRKALGDDPRLPRVIQTIHKGGYRLLLPIRWLDNAQNEHAPAASSSIDTVIDRHPERRLPNLLLSGKSYVALVMLASLVVAGYTVRSRYMKPKQIAEHKVMLLVLPFEDLSNDPEQDFFADGMTEEMITQLGSLRPSRLGVIARASAMRYKGSKKSIPEINKDLNVDYVLEGSVRRSGNRVRVTAQLIQVSDQSHLWAQSYDRELRDILGVQAEVAAAVAKEVRINLPVQGAVAHIARHAPSPEAYDNYLRGQYYLHRYMREDPHRPATYFEKAIATDSDFAAAYIGLASCYLAMAFGGIPAGGMPPTQAIPKGEAAALTALELDPDSPAAHAILAEVNLRYHWDWQAAEREARRAVELNPNMWEGHDAYSDYLAVMGRFDEALAERKRTLEINPLWPEMSMELGSAYEFQGRYDEAIAAYRHAAELDPEMRNGAHWAIGEVYREKGMYKENIEEWLIPLRANGQQARADRMAQLYATQGYQEAMNHFLSTAVQRRLARKKRGEYVDPIGMADLYTRLGDRENALAYLNRAFEERSWGLPFVKYNFATLGSDPRFADLLQRIGVP
jgi:TolB-like protein